ncbi:hydrolase [Azospirillum brasilense]|uniref:Hydrolase n=1 Tax=Azospirillum brasilense TaxID=192 RepID=A0A235HH37_AZOBR|nr:hydrolase [Azospirillum brasilense]OYD85171.1 hydrolase [Azospirillum brasilense]
MLLSSQRSVLVVVDIQEKLMPAIAESERVERNAATLLKAAGLLGVPAFATEQYPRGLGPTAASLRALLPPDGVVEKISFSAAREPAFLERLERLGRRQVVLAGSEAHVCVMQTALSLVGLGYDVVLVADAVSSRVAANAELGIARMRAAGATIVSTEMVLFEWMERSDIPAFKAVLELIR